MKRTSFPFKMRIFMSILVALFTIQLVSQNILASGVIVTIEISGRTVDDRGNKLSEAIVNLYDSSGTELISNAYSDEEGVFHLYFRSEGEPTGNYLVIFKKKGYVTYSKTLSITWPGKDVINLGDVQLSPSLKLTMTVTSRETAPGTRLDLPFTLSNVGKDEVEECSLLVSCPSGWDVKIVDENTPLTGLRLYPSSTIQLKLRVVVPVGASGENLLTLTAAGSINVSQMVTIIVTEGEESVLSCQYPSVSGYLGGTVSFQCTVQNPFISDLRLGLSLESVPKGFRCYIKNSEKALVNEIQLQPGKSIGITVDVEIDRQAELGLNEFVLKATSKDVNATLRLKIMVREYAGSIQIKSKYPSQVTTQGATVKFPISIRSFSQTEEVFTLSAEEAPTGWQISFKTQDGQEIRSLLIAADGVETINVFVTPSINCPPGTYRVPIEVSSERTSANATLETVVSGSYGISLDLSTIYLSIQAGSRQSLTAQIRNTGYSPLTNVEVVTTYLTSGWNFETAPLRVSVLEPNARVQFQITI
ncbi:MAG: NEW3 domain-containing protein, partial [Candidatus Bathyarchaeia archaeon]